MRQTPDIIGGDGPPAPSSSPPSSPKRPHTPPTSKFFKFLRSELHSASPPPADDDEIPEAQVFALRRREKVYTFVTIPRELEKLMGYGFFQCADAFLYIFTFLPLRCVLAIYEYVSGYLAHSTASLKSSDKCELLKAAILIACCWLFMYIDTNVLYHVIKSQSVIKLYIFFNMLEVGDRLFGCFSQDTLDALFITATEKDDDHAASSSSSPSSPPSHKSRTRAIKKLSTTTHAIICGVSILGHALVILLQSTTLSVAINANNRALLTVMMSNNFVELKGAVFKKFDKMNLFQVSCSDIRERFHLFILLLIVCLQTLREYSWEESRFWVLLPDCLMVLLAEIGVDWVKHAFITRFNDLPLDVYIEMTASLAYDMAESVKRKQSGGGFNDYSDVVGRRLGFVPLPLAIVLIRVVSPMWRVNDRLIGILVLSTLGYIALATFRVLNMVVLVGKAVRIIDEHSSKGKGGNSTVPPEETTTQHQENGHHHHHHVTVKNSILKRTRTISGSDGDLLALKLGSSSTGKADKKLQFEDGINNDRDEGLLKSYLLANSNVSLYSVGFNEEMMKVEMGIGKVGGGGGAGDLMGAELLLQPPKPLISSERKHSLGSNLYEGVLLGGIKVEGVDETSASPVKLECDEVEDSAFNQSFGDASFVEVSQQQQQQEAGPPEELTNVESNQPKDEVVVKDEEQPETAATLPEPVTTDEAVVDNVKLEDTTTTGSRPSSSSKTSKRIINWFK